MKIIEDSFTSKGFDYSLVARTSTGLCFRKTLPGGPGQWFEVFQKRINPERTVIIDGNPVTYTESEAFPSDESFGKWAWCFTDEAKALEKLAAIEPHKSTVAK